MLLWAADESIAGAPEQSFTPSGSSWVLMFRRAVALYGANALAVRRCHDGRKNTTASASMPRAAGGAISVSVPSVVALRMLIPTSGTKNP